MNQVNVRTNERRINQRRLVDIHYRTLARARHTTTGRELPKNAEESLNFQDPMGDSYSFQPTRGATTPVKKMKTLRSDPMQDGPGDQHPYYQECREKSLNLR